MFLAREQIERSTDWLLEHGSPPVQYLTRKYILKDASDELANLWQRVEACQPAQNIFARQGADGSWCAGGAWAAKPSYTPGEGYEPTTPKYATTAWILPLLGDMGFDQRDKRIRRACNYLLTYQWANGFFATSHGAPARKYRESGRLIKSPCHFALYLLAFSKVGAGNDPQLKKSFDLLVSWQRDDGGWLDERHLDGSASPYKIWDRGCPWSTHHAASALYHAGLPEYEETLKKSLEFVVWHLSTKSETEICQFYYHGHNVIRELLMLSEIGIGLDSRPVTALLEWLMTMYDEQNGHFRYSGKPISKYSRKKNGVSPRVLKYRLYHLIDDDWLTYYLTRVAKNLIDK